MNKDQIIDKLNQTKSENEWNTICSQVKEESNGYPDWWFEAIVISGVAHKAKNRWKEFKHS